MTLKTITTAGCAAAIALSGVSPAFAQAPAAPAAALAVTHGNPIAGLCVISVEGAIGASTVGKYIGTRMQQLVGQVNAELNAEKTAIDNEAKTLDGQRATLDQNTLEQRAAALQVRANALNRKAQLRDQEISRTEEKAVGRVGSEMEPLIRQAYQQKGCSMLLNRNAVILGHPSSDITSQVVTALNGKIQTLAVERERLDQAQPGAAAAQPRR